jgi:hypothetical protein
MTFARIPDTVHAGDRGDVRRLASKTAANVNSKINSGNQITHVMGEDQFVLVPAACCTNNWTTSPPEENKPSKESQAGIVRPFSNNQQKIVLPTAK